jgi:hypothetical protein
MRSFSLPTQDSSGRVIVGPNGQNVSIAFSDGDLTRGTAVISLDSIGKLPIGTTPPLPRGPVVYPGLPIDFPILPTTRPGLPVVLPGWPIDLPTLPSTGKREPRAPFNRPIKPEKEEDDTSDKEPDTKQEEQTSGGWFDWIRKPFTNLPFGPMGPIEHPFGNLTDVRNQ